MMRPIDWLDRSFSGLVWVTDDVRNPAVLAVVIGGRFFLASYMLGRDLRPQQPWPSEKIRYYAPLEPPPKEMHVSSSHRCPYCGSSEVSGLMQAFWVAITDTGDATTDWGSLQAETEIGSERMCRDCEKEWRYG